MRVALSHKPNENWDTTASRRDVLEYVACAAAWVIWGWPSLASPHSPTKYFKKIISEENSLIKGEVEKSQAIEKIRLSEQIIWTQEMEFFYNFFLSYYLLEKKERWNVSTQELWVYIIEQIQSFWGFKENGIFSPKLLKTLYTRYYFHPEYPGSFYNNPDINFSQEQRARWKVFIDSEKSKNRGIEWSFDEETIFSNKFFHWSSGKPYTNNEPISWTFIAEDLYKGIKIPKGLEFPKKWEWNTLTIYQSLGYCVLGLYDQNGDLIVLTDSKIMQNPWENIDKSFQARIQSFPYPLMADAYFIYWSHSSKEELPESGMCIEVPLYFMTKIFNHYRDVRGINIIHNVV